MGLLSDRPMPPRRSQGPGERFVRLFCDVLDDEDRERVRRWDEDPLFPTAEIHRRIASHYGWIGYTTVERGLARLRESSWAC